MAAKSNVQYANNMSRVAALLFAALAMADGMEMDEPQEFHPKHAGAKTAHWIFTLAFLLILPSVTSAITFAERYRVSVGLHIVLLVYSAAESLFMDFPDNVDNHENRTSKGTSWFLTWELGLAVFIGTVVNGLNLVMNRFWPKLAETLALLRWATRLYKTVAFTTVLTGWVRVCIAPVALFGFCYGRSTGQCIAHGIMGSLFVLYGFVIVWTLTIPWIRNHVLMGGAPRKSYDFWDSAIMCLWGIVNTFTEHRWGREGWSHGDYQHTSMGIVWWCGGLLGMWLSRNNGVRNFVPSLLLIYTGYAMSEHAQHLAISTKVHAMFGLVLMMAGLCRIIEITFLLKGAAASETGKVLPFQHLPPFCLVLSGVMFMAANEQQLELVHALGADHSSYILVVVGAGFMVYLWIVCTVAFYLWLVGYDENGELKAPGYDSVADTFELEDYDE